MKRNLFALLVFLVTVSCSQNVIEESPLNNIGKDLDVSNFIKDISGNIVDKIPLDVYDRLISDLKDSGKDESVNVLETYYVRDETNFVLKKNLMAYLQMNKVQTRVNNFFSYRSHLRNIGWGNYSYLGQITGTTGQKREMEALSFSYPYYTFGFRARAHVTKKGWLPWANLGEDVGTTGEKRNMEAIQIDVEPSFATNVYYKVHMKNIGWGPLVSNGEISGTMGESRSIEAFVLYMYII